MATIGTCGNCGGAVEIPDVWNGIYPPTPQCRSCNSVPAEPHGKTIKMRPLPSAAPLGSIRKESPSHD